MTNREANAGFAEASRWLDGTRPLHWQRRSRRALITALAIALVISSVSAAYQTWVYRTEPATRAEFDPLYAGARVLLRGNDPYAAVGPAREFDWHSNLLSPTRLVGSTRAAVSGTSVMNLHGTASLGDTRARHG